MDKTLHDPGPVMTLDDAALDLLFRAARSHNGWQDRPVPIDTLRAVYEVLKWGPTSTNSLPARFIFLTTPEAKERLRPALGANNVDKTRTAPVVVIVGFDVEFFEHSPRMFPQANVKPLYEKNPTLAEVTAFRNGTLQGAYLMLAARALGLDCGAMSGFDNAKVDQEFFAGTNIKSNFLCCLGHGDEAKLRPRGPRFDFDEVCQVL